MRLKKPTVAVSTVVLLALAACGGSGTGGPGDIEATNQEGGAAGQGKDENRQAPAAPIEGAQKGGTVKVLSVNGLNTMDPTEAYYLNTGSILTNLVVRTLTQYVYDPDTGDMVLIPDLATDLGRSNEDYTEWTFTIRDGIKYENGQEVTADDIAYGIKRSFDRATFPDGADYSNQYFLDGDTYKGPYKSGPDYKGVEVHDNDITIKMAKPFPDMPYWGAMSPMSPIPEGKSSDPAKYALHPWATGPYMFDDYTPEKELTLVRNPNWDPATDPGRHAYVDKWVMDLDTETAKIEQIMLADEAEGQTTITFDNLTSGSYLQMKSQDPDRIVEGSDPCTFMWFPDYRKIKEIEVRQALAYAFPYEAAHEAAGYIIGVTRTLGGDNIMPPGIPGREEYETLPGSQTPSTDPEKAKALLAQAGYQPGEYEISFLYTQDEPTAYNGVDAKDQIVKALTEAGFDPKPYATTVADLSTLRSDPDTKINVRSGGWCSDWPSGASWFPPLFATPNIKEGLGADYAVFGEPAVDKAIDKVLELPIEDQPAAWNKLDQQVMRDYFPVFVTGYSGVVMSKGSKIEGMYDDPVYGMPTWKDMSVSQ